MSTQKATSCKACPLYTARIEEQGFQENPSLVCIIPAPEPEHSTAMYEVLVPVLQHLGVDPKRVAILAATQCSSNESWPDQEVVAACTPIFEDVFAQQLATTPVDIPIIVFGQDALHSPVLGIMEKLTVVHGFSYWLESGHRVIPTWHPRAVRNNPDLFIDFVQEMESAVLYNMPCPVTREVRGELTNPPWVEDVRTAVRRLTREEDLDDAEIEERLEEIEEEHMGAMPDFLADALEITHVRTPSQVDSLHSTMVEMPATIFCCDLETSGLNPYVDEILCIAIGLSETEAAIIWPTAFANPTGGEKTRRLLENPSFDWVLHNAKFDARFLRSMKPIGAAINIAHDTMLMHYVLDERIGTHGLKMLCRRKLGLPDYESELRRILPSKATSYKYIPPTILAVYAARDVCFTLRLLERLEEELLNQDEADALMKLYDFLIWANQGLTEIEEFGIHIDIEAVQKQKIELQEAQDTLKLWLQDYAREFYGIEELNTSSPKQLAIILYDHMNMPTVQLFRNHKDRSTGREALDKLSAQFPDNEFLTQLIKLRDVAKILSTYIKPIEAATQQHDSRLHTDFKLHGTVTGRLSAASPNLMNIPRASTNAYARQIRNFFTATPGMVLVGADYSQAELRVLAVLSDEPFFKRVYDEGRDMHDEATTMLYNLQPPGKDASEAEKYAWKEKRMIAKMLNFGLVYGRSAKSIAIERGMDIAEAQDIMNRYFAQMPLAAKWLQDVRNEAVTNGFLQSPMGRLRRFGMVSDRNKWKIQNQASNFPIQGAASDICLKALVDIHYWLKDNNKGRALLPVHDFIMVECAPEDGEEVRLKLEEIMRGAAEFVFPDTKGIIFEADADIDTLWGNL